MAYRPPNGRSEIAQALDGCAATRSIAPIVSAWNWMAVTSTITLAPATPTWTGTWRRHSTGSEPSGWVGARWSTVRAGSRLTWPRYCAKGVGPAGCVAARPLVRAAKRCALLAPRSGEPPRGERPRGERPRPQARRAGAGESVTRRSQSPHDCNPRVTADVYGRSTRPRCSASARKACPRWEISFFSCGLNSAQDRSYPSGTRIGSYPNPPEPRGSVSSVPAR